MTAFAIDAPQHAALWESVAAALRRAIVCGELPAGVHLEEAALAQKFDVSRVPIREAIARLERDGLVRIEPRRGAFVVGFAEQEAADVCECRRLIERRAVRRAARRVHGSGLDRLRAVVEEMDAAVRRDGPELAASDLEFHRQIVCLAKNRFLLSAWEPIAGLVATMLEATHATDDDRPGAVVSHRAILEALARADGAAAERLLDDHLRKGERAMRGALRRLARRGLVRATGG
jgi:DNA-binding GntR family transcriptional regulator